MRIVLVAVLLLLAACTGPGGASTSPADLLALDREFSSYSAGHGFADAFERFAAPDVTAIFAGGEPIEGRDNVVQALADGTYTLTWEPAAADVSSALGYTYGAYTLQPAAAQAAPQRGHYVTVWQRQPDGRWLARVDIGNK